MVGFLFFLLFIEKLYFFAMAQDKNKSESANKEAKRSDDFQKRVDAKKKVIELARELLVSTTEDEFSKLGYEQVEGEAGFYGNGKSYGSGSKESRYSIKIEGVTNASLTKKIQFGAKRMQSDINFELKENIISIEYTTTEAGFFRGVDKEGIPYTLDKTISIDVDNESQLKSKMKDFFKMASKK